MAAQYDDGSYVYPYIPKKYFKAVMYACSLIKKYRTFNVACRTAANYYGVEEAEVRKHVSARSAAGKKCKQSKKRG